MRQANLKSNAADMTIEDLEREADALRKANVRRSLRDEYLRLNALTRLQLESTGCRTIGELRTYMAKLSPKKGNTNATSTSN